MTPVIDLSFLTIESQAVELFDRLKAGKRNPSKAVKAEFIVNSTARAVVESIINDKELFLFVKPQEIPSFFLAT